MAEERIDIKVTDSGSDKAAKGLRAIASEAVKAESAIKQLETAMKRSGGASPSNAAASAARNAAREYDKARREADRLNSRADALRSSLDASYAAQHRYNQELAEAQSLYKAGAINIGTYNSALSASKARLDAAKAAQDRLNNSTKLAGHHQANLVAQINDIGVSMASGQNPFIVLLQQGSQLQDLSMRVDGGFKTLARSTLALVAPFAAAAAVFGVMAIQFNDFKKEIDKDTELKKYVKTLGLTKKELKELEDVHVTFGDVALGTWDTFNQALDLSSKFEAIKNGFSSTIDFIWGAFKNFTFGLMAAITGTYKSIITVWNNLPAAFSDIFTQAVNKSIEALQNLANNSIDVLNKLGGNFEHITLTKMENANAGAASRMGKEFVDNYISEFKDFEAGYNLFADVTSQNAAARAKARLDAQAAKIIDDRSDKKNSGLTDAEKREEALRKINAQLDNEISRLGMLKKEREIQQRFDQIEEQLLSKRITLTETEASAIKEKISQVRELAEVQSEMDRIYDELNGAEDRYTTTVNALNTMLDKGAISYENYIKQTNKAIDTYEESTNPLRSLEREQAALNRTLGKYGPEAQRAAYYEQIRNTLMKEGIVISAQYVAGENAKVDALMKGNEELQRRLELQRAIDAATAPFLPQAPTGTSNGDIMKNATAMYEELERQRAQDLMNEEEYNRRKAALDKALYTARLGFASEFFGNLSVLSSSGNRELAAIGKAAAVTQATIDGYLAIQKTLAAYPAPWNYVMAASVGVKTAANIAGIMSTNVGNFATGGQVMVGGRDGVDKNNINMNVTKGERVTIETPAQQKATDEAIARGQNGSGGDVKITSVNVVDPRFVIDSMDTAAGSRVITNIIQANRREINAILGSR